MILKQFITHTIHGIFQVHSLYYHQSRTVEAWKGNFVIALADSAYDVYALSITLLDMMW